MKTVNIAVTPRLKAARQSYVACPRPRTVSHPMAVWEAEKRSIWFHWACRAACVVITVGTIAFIWSTS